MIWLRSSRVKRPSQALPVTDTGAVRRSVRWTRDIPRCKADLSTQYSLAISDGPSARAARRDDIRIERTGEDIIVATDGAQYVFRNHAGCFDELRLALNQDQS